MLNHDIANCQMDYKI